MNSTKQSSRVLRRSLAFARARRNFRGLTVRRAATRDRDEAWQAHLRTNFAALFAANVAAEPSCQTTLDSPAMYRAHARRILLDDVREIIEGKLLVRKPSGGAS